MANTTADSRSEEVLPVNRYDRSDSLPHMVFDLNAVTVDELVKGFKVHEEIARQLVDLRRERPIKRPNDLLTLDQIQLQDFESLRRCGLGNADSRFAVTDVQPSAGYIYSSRPYSLRVFFANPGRRHLALLSIQVRWQGEPFRVEKAISPEDLAQGYSDVPFNAAQTLPPGPATFLVDLFDREGGQSSFRVTCVVLPSNPLSLSLAPTTYYVTGTYSLRGYYNAASDTYQTHVRLSIHNGNAFAVNMSRNVTWEFWDGGVGSTLKESGTHTWSSSISVPANGTWSGTLMFTSPAGSGIHETYESKEDMTVRIVMTTTGGTSISDTITARVMVAFGIDIIRVASDTFVGQEYTDLYAAVDVTQSIYEARDISVRDVGRYHIADSAAGSYQFMNSEDECHDLFADWSAASGGSNIDCFVAHDFIGVGFDGLAGDIPGPAGHSGRESGVVVDKTGYVDATGVKRLSVDYLGMLIAHELGHYLGLSHLSVSGNLMHPSSGTYDTDLTYDQYREVLDHGWMFVD
jgi:hypothetical protein